MNKSEDLFSELAEVNRQIVMANLPGLSRAADYVRGSECEGRWSTPDGRYLLVESFDADDTGDRFAVWFSSYTSVSIGLRESEGNWEPSDPRLLQPKPVLLKELVQRVEQWFASVSSEQCEWKKFMEVYCKCWL